MTVCVANLDFFFGQQCIFRDISFSLKAGEILSIIGPNGAGKSTLLRCLNGLLIPAAGDIRIGAQNISSMNRQLLGKTIGYVPQNNEDTFGFTVLDMVLMGRAAHIGLFDEPGEHDREVASSALSLVGLESLRERNFNELSGGQAQLVIIARALAAEPDVLLLDEPTSHLDIFNQAQVLKVLKSLSCDRRLSVIMTTHNPDHAFLFSSKTLLMRPGGSALFGHPDEVMNAETIRDIYGIDVNIVSYSAQVPTLRTVIPDWLGMTGKEQISK